MFGWNRRRKPSDFEAEVESHRQLEADRLREEGVPDEEARAAAQRAFGNVLAARERFHEAGRWMWADNALRDLGYAGALFGIVRPEAGSLAALSAMVLDVALVAGFLPARRAAALDPAAVLRGD